MPISNPALTLFVKVFTGKVLFIGLVSLVLFPNLTVHAATYTQTQTCTIPTQITNWNQSCSVPRFNTALGELLSVRFEMTGNIDSIARVENKDATTITVTTDVTASITLTRPDTSTLVGVLPTQSGSDTFPSFDGTIDFAGTSGKTFPNLIASQSDSFISTAAPDLLLFSGTGNIVLPVNASGTSNFSGSANLATSVDTQAGASVNVIYSYLAQNLSINKSHSGVFTAGNNAIYTLTVNNLESSASIGTITVTDTLPAGMSFISNSNPDWSCSQTAQILTCTSSAIIPANGSSIFNITVSTNPSIATNVTNTAQVASTYIDPDLSNNQTSDPTIVNHIPVVNNFTISPILNNVTQLLPSSIFGGNANDVGDSLQNFTILTLPSNTLGTLYLGNPATTGVVITPNQVLSLIDITNVYFVPVLASIGSATFEFTSIDSFSATPSSPATITLPITNVPATSSSGNTIILGQNVNPNLSSQSTSNTTAQNSPVTTQTQGQNTNQNIAVPPQKPTQVLGEFENIIKTNNQLIRTGFESENITFIVLAIVSMLVLISTVWLSIRKV